MGKDFFRRLPAGLADDRRVSATKGTSNLTVAPADSAEEVQADRAAAAVQRSLASSGPTAASATSRIRPRSAADVRIHRKMAFGAKDLRGETSVKAKINDLRGERSTFDQIRDHLKRYEAATDRRVELRELQELEVLAIEWLAQRSGSSKSDHQTKRQSIEALLRACRDEIDTMGAEMDSGYSQRLQATNRRSPGSTAIDAGFQYLSGSGAQAVTDAKMGQARTDAPAAARSLTDAELAAIRIYTAGDYRTMNPTLEGSDSWLAGQTKKLTGSKATKQSKAVVGAEGGWSHAGVKSRMESSGGAPSRKERRNLKVEAFEHSRLAAAGLKKLPTTSGTGYRGMGMLQSRLDQDYKKGSEIVYKPFVSTSTKREMSAAFANQAQAPEVPVLFELTITHGYDINDLSANKGEAEILLPPGARFTVAADPVLQGRTWIVKLTQAGHGAAGAAPAGAPAKLDGVPPSPAVEQVVPGPTPPLKVLAKMPSLPDLPRGVRPALTKSPSMPQLPTRPGQAPARPAHAPVPTAPAGVAPAPAPALPVPAGAPKTDASTPVDPEAALKSEAAAQARALIQRARDAEPGVTGQLSRIAATNKAKLEGLNHKLKTEASLSRKLADRARTRVTGGDYKGAVQAEAAKVNDVLRYTLVTGNSSYQALDADLRTTMQKSGYQLRNYWNAWEDANSKAYNGVNVTFQTKDGQLFEVQLHTKGSLKAKESIHDLYEEWRAESTTPARRAELTEIMKKKWKKVPTPKGIKKVAK